MEASTIQARAERHRRIAQFLEDFSQIAAEDPSLASEILRELGATNGHPRALPSDRKLSRFDSIAASFIATNNRWSDVEAIAAHSKIKTTAIRDVIYKSHRESFDSKSHSEDGRRKLFRLKDAILAQVKHDFGMNEPVFSEGGSQKS